MDVKNKIDNEGISLRTLFGWLIVIAVLISGLMIFSTFRMSATFNKLSGAMEEYIELEKAAYKLMDASDYLTEKAQRFTVDGKRQYMDDYFTEAFETNRREAAIEKLSENENSKAALEQLQEAMAESKDLMNQEYYAMKLVIEARGYTDYPDVLKDVKLTDEDAALSDKDKMRRATELVLGEEYYVKKDIIRENMKESLEELEKLARGLESSSAVDLKRELLMDRIIILLQAVGIFALIWLTSVLGINPVLKAVDRIKEDDPIPEMGANEFRYLARTYNKMYSVYKKSIEHLNYKASHDELTGVYNRAGYDLLLESIDLSTTYMMIIDVDDFKEINDTHGHETGDSILVKVAATLRNYFRSDDYVCRIGGDEFIVFMVHADDGQNKLIGSKIKAINIELSETADGLPPVSVSVGVAHGTGADSGQSLFEKADIALYQSKNAGKSGYTFYEQHVSE